ncbi:unnamed protein product [marine sediment metagenome]|uniref:Uncharacterized protein n=1 Tax=marine sediment metagenome TaxID=412755 RepID=X1HZ97_9ZZZZ
MNSSLLFGKRATFSGWKTFMTGAYLVRFGGDIDFQSGAARAAEG